MKSMASSHGLLFQIAVFSAVLFTFNACRAEDKFEPLLKALYSVPKRAPNTGGLEISRLEGSSSSLRRHSYAAIVPYKISVPANTQRTTSFQKSFVRTLMVEIEKDMRKLNLDVNYSMDWPYVNGSSWGRMRVKTKKEDLPPIAAMVDVRLFSVSDESAFVTMTFHVMHLSDPNTIPNLQPEKTTSQPEKTTSQPEKTTSQPEKTTSMNPHANQ